ncbi:hypothetical protein ATCC90586_001377 [Pythium insidiosum]|nr:hypothetical protein ATCC90586_001377 [Pythium insidiosum]
MSRRMTRDGDSSAASCAAISVSSADVGELLHIVALLRRVDIEPRALLSALDYGGDGCPLSGWCSFCDGGDRRLQLGVVTRDPLELETALFEYDASTAEQDVFVSLIQEAAGELMAGQRGDLGVAGDQLPPLELVVDGALWPNTARSVQQLRDLLTRYTAAVAHGELPLLRISCIDASSRMEEMKALIARFGIPMADKNRRHWTWVLEAAADDQGEQDGAPWTAGSTLLATSKLIKLQALVRTKHGDCSHRLHAVLRCHPTALRDLRVHYDLLQHSHGATRMEIVHGIADALFSRRSCLRLDRLHINAPITQDDLCAILVRLKAEPELTPEQSRRRPRLQELVCKWWRWQQGHGPQRCRGQTVAELLRLMGGVSSLRLEDQAVPVAELPALAECRSLHAKISFDGWKALNQRDDEPSHPRLSSRLERLSLETDDEHQALVNPALHALLRRVGRPLQALSLANDHVSPSFDSETVETLTQLCPNLRELDVGAVSDSFIAQLVDSSRAWRLEQLALRVGQPLPSFAPLLTALSDPTHRLAATVRSLRLGFVSLEGLDVDQLVASIQDVLASNTRLLNVSVCLDPEVDDMRVALDPSTGYAVVAAPMRFRLAVLSALCRYGLPRGILETILEMSTRAHRRLRVEGGVR